MKKYIYIILGCLLSFSRTYSQASFTAPDTVCVNTPITMNNTSTGAITYNWNFCNSDLNAVPNGFNLGNIGGNLSSPVFMDYVLENGNYYAFVVNHNPGEIVRLDFGNSLLNTPTSISLGNIGGVMNVSGGSEGIQIIKNNGKYFIYVVGGSPNNGMIPKLLRFEFGSNITNTNPIATDFGNIGNLRQSIDLFTFQNNGNWYGFTVNSENNTLTRFDFTNDLTNTPTVLNLGNISNLLNYPTGICALNDNGFWRVFITNGGGNSDIVRLDFGNSLLNPPTGVSLGNPNNSLKSGRDLIINNYCNGIVGFVVNGGDNTITRLNFNSLSSPPSAVNLGNLGNFNFPHSLAKLFRVGAENYSFVTNVNNNTITRLKFSGCTNSSISNSSSQTPPQISYNTAGTYNINLTIDEGLPTQSSFCKQVVVKNCAIPCTVKPDFTFTRSFCNPKQITFKNETSNTSSFLWNFGNNTTNNTNQSSIVNYAAYNSYNVKLVVTQTNGCIDSVEKNIPVTTQFTNGLIKNSDTTICNGVSFNLNVQDSGVGFCWSASNGTVSNNSANITVAPTANTTYYYNTQTLGTNLIINGDFENGNTSFQTDYTYHPSTAGGVQGIYHIATNPNVWLSAFSACKDHTSNGGNMMMIDGSTIANADIWKQTVNVQANTNYVFSGWVQSIVAQNPAQLVFKINGNAVGTILTANLTSCTWKQFSIQWNSGSTTTANISITNNNLIAQGNDFAIDDIVFAPVNIKTDSVNVLVNNCPIANPNCNGVVKLSGRDKITPPQANFKKYFPPTGFTWETWFNGSYFDNNNTTVDTRSKLIAATDIPSTTQDIVLGFGWPQVAKKRELCFVVDGPNGNSDRDNSPCTYFPTGGFLPNTWYHVAGVRDYANNTSKLYVNGILVDSKTNNHQPLNPNSNIIFPNFYFGSMTGIGNVDSGFAGKMDEIRIWNYPRNATEIQANYDKCLGGNETGLVAYYHSNEGKGTTLKDASLNKNNATLSTAVTWDKTDNAPLTTTCYQSTFANINKTICYKDTFQNHTVSGVYNDTLTNSYGCDSIVTLNLTVLPAPTNLKDTFQGCGSVVFNSISYTANTVVTTSFKNYLGCDSIIIQHQIIITNKRDTISKSICFGGNYLGHTSTFDTTFKLANSCDSILTIIIKQDGYIRDSITKSICGGETYFGYNITGIYRDTFNTATCDSIRTLNLIASFNLNPKLQQDTSICSGDYVNLYPGNYKKYVWNTGSISSSIKVKDIGLYWVEVSDSIGCKARDSFVLINIFSKPSNFLPSNLQVCLGEIYTLNGYQNYNWITGENTPSIALNGLNNYWLKVLDINGCSGLDTMKVTYSAGQNTNDVNAFSPNGDGINEEFKPFNSSCLLQYQLSIYNRWGQQVFQTTNANKGWNGTVNGKLLPTDVYYFIINYKTVTGINATKSGSITLLR